MGGLAEGSIQSKPPEKGGPGTIIGQVQKLRFHRTTDNKEIHFHDDKAKLKVAIPAVEWWVAWERVLKNPNAGSDEKPWTWVDAKNKTMITLTVKVVQPRRPRNAEVAPPPIIDIYPTLTKVEFGEVFQKLDAFFNARK